MSPDDATDKTVSWSSTNESVATVDSDGVVTAVGEGTATITVTTTDGGFSASCQVSVDVPDPKVSISDADVTIAAATYTGEALEPAVTVTLGGRTLVAGTDYTLSYKDNVGPARRR